MDDLLSSSSSCLNACPVLQPLAHHAQQHIVNHVDEMFELEFDVKMKAQLKYMEVKASRKHREGLFNALRHDYLWTPTTTFYLGASLVFFLLRKRQKWAYWHLVPFMIVPTTLDYVKREYYVSMVEEKDRKELNERRQLIQQIIAEKKRHVTFEQAMRYLFKLNLDRPVPVKKEFLPLTF